MEWQHKAANNFNGFPMRLQTLGVARAGHSTSTLNWLHSSLSSPTPPPRFLHCSFVAAAACECLSQLGREKKDEAEATPMPCECCGTVWMRSECEWVRVWVSVIVNVHVNGNGFWTTGNALFHAQFHSGIYYAKCGAVWREEVPETAFH